MTAEICLILMYFLALKLFFTVRQQEETNVLPLVKQEKVERDDCNLDLKVEVNIRAECGLSAGECSSVSLWMS